MVRLIVILKKVIRLKKVLKLIRHTNCKCAADRFSWKYSGLSRGLACGKGKLF